MNNRKKILICGGHITPAIAVSDELRKRNTEVEIIFVGRLKALEGGKIDSEEVRIVKARGFRFLSISAGRVTRVLTLLGVVGIVRIPFGFFRAFQICIAERPDIIVSFGGYVALPIVLAGWILGIPSITHEQTLVPGLANRIIARFARRVCVSFAETATAFPKHKTTTTGLPLRESIFHPPASPPFRFADKKPLLFVTGGSTGAQSLNRLIFPIARDLTSRFRVIHQTGRLDFSNAPKISGYIAAAYFEESDYAWVITHARLIIGRSGANTIGEIASLGKIALFVPLPWSGGNEQYENARYLEKAGTSRVLNQKNLTSDRLLTAIDGFWADEHVYRSNAAKLSQEFPRNAAASVAHQVIKILSHA